MSPMLAAALELIEAGWSVFPCIEKAGPREKSPYTRNGFKDASSDPERVRAWWSNHPQAMIGAPVPNSLVVLDIDPRNGGSYEALVDALGVLPETLTAWSGRNDGGRHLYFLRPAGVLSSERLPAGVDLKRSGYCILPPSVHPTSGLPYRWDARPIAELPWRARLMLKPKPRPKAFDAARVASGDGAHLVAWLDNFREDGINNALYWAAARAHEAGLDLDEQLITRAVEYGESERQARKTVESAKSAPARAGGQR